MVSTRLLACGISCLLGLAAPLLGAQARPVTASDCVNVKYVTGGDIRGPIAISPDGERVAYEVKVPDIEEDKNTFELYVKDLREGKENGNGELIARGENFSNLQWTKNGRDLLMLARDQNVVVVKDVDVASKLQSIFFRAPTSILEYALDRDGNTIVYSTDLAPAKRIP